MKKSILFLLSLLSVVLLQAGSDPGLSQRLAEHYRLEQESLLSDAQIFGTQEVLSRQGELVVRTAGYALSGFYNMEQNWDAARIQQLEVTVRSDTPGYFRLSGNLEAEGKRTQFKQVIASVIPDGQYRTIIFDFQNNSAWKGTVTNWELAWFGPKGAEVGLKCIDALPAGNQLPAAADFQPGVPVPAPYLRPRAKCRLSWKAGECPGVTLRFKDHRMQELPGTAVVLEKGASAVEFTTPVEMILAEATVEGDAEGYPVLEQLEYKAMFDTQGKWRGNWLWFRTEEGPDDYNVWFERDIDLDEEPDYASMAFLADDVAYVYVNKIYCGCNEVWQVPVRCNITHALKKGHNRIQVRVKNGAQAAGFAADLYVHSGGKDYFLDTDSEWRCESKLNQPHKIPDTIEEPVVILGNPHTTAPWNGGISYRYAGPRGELSVLQAEPGKFTARVEKLPPVEVDSLLFVLTEKSGLVKTFTLPITPASREWKPGEEISIAYKLPPLEEGDFTITTDDDFVGLRDEAVLGEVHIGQKPAPELRQARFVNAGTRPYILLGERKITPYFWHGTATIRKKRFFEFPLAERCGMDNFRLIAELKDFWTGEDQYDFRNFDEAVDAMFAAQPDAVFCIHIYMQMPVWWLDANPGEVTSFMDGSKSFADQYKQSLASQKWLKDGEVPLRAFLEHVKSKSYADRIWGVSIAENNNGEWFWDLKDNKLQYGWGGYNQADIQYFQSFLREKYGTDQALAEAWHQPGATIEGVTSLPDWHLAMQSSLGVLLDPVKDQRVMDWLESRNVVLARAINFFTGVVKDATQGKWLTGVYYGYLTELICNSYRGLLLTGHNGLWEVLQSGNVDFLSAPSRYTYRKTGDSDGIMQPWSSLALHGKVAYNEMDYRTGYYRIPESESMRYYVGEPSTAYESVGHLNRAFGMNLATGITGYWFDLSVGGLYEKAIDDIIQEQSRVYSELPPVQGSTPCEVAVVGDIASAYYTRNPDEKGVYTNGVEGLFHQLSHLAIPFRSLLVDDLLDSTIQVPCHKLYIMLPTLALSQEKRALLMERLEKEGATVLWLYAAAPFYPGKSASAEANADFLGIRTRLVTDEFRPSMTTIPEYGEISCVNGAASAPWFVPVDGYDEEVGYAQDGTAWMVRKKIGAAEHFYCALMNLPAEAYRELLSRARIRQYVTGLDDQVWVGNDLLFVYAVKGGTKRLNLPAGYQAKAIIGPLPEGTALPANGTFEALPALTYGFLVCPQ